jgi:C-terminal processing protease CtpA/Prc
MSRRILSLALPLLLILTPFWAAAQESADKPLAIGPKERELAVTELGTAFDERYVFPEVGRKVKETLQVRLKEGAYDKIETGQELARVLTAQLQELTRDKHVRVNCSTKPLPKRQENQRGPTPEEMKEHRREMRLLNATFFKVERMPGNIGYIRLDRFVDPEAGKEPLQAAMMFIQNTDALILDLRYNGGGTPLMIRDLCSYFFDAKPVHLNSMYFRKDDRKEEFWTNKEVPGPRYLNKDVYVLTSAFTFSGGEECAYNFQTQKRGTIVGVVTGGGAHPGGMVPIADHYRVFIPTGRAINPITGTNWEGVGVKPDVAVDADQALEKAHELAVKKLIDTPDKKLSERIREDVQMMKEWNERARERRLATLEKRKNGK